MILSRTALTLLLCCAGCTARRLPADGGSLDAHPNDGLSDAADVRSDILPPSLPWVSTFAGKDCKPYTGDGDRSQVEFQVTRYVRVDLATGDVYFADVKHVLVAHGDQIRSIAGSTATQGDGPAHLAGFTDIMSFAVGTDGSIFVAEPRLIRWVSQGMVTTLAGNADEGRHVDGPGSSARFQNIKDVSVATDGSLLIADTGSIRRLKDGIVSTVVGKVGCPPMSPHDDGPADQVCLLSPNGLLVEDGGVYFGESSRLRLWKAGVVSSLGGDEQSDNIVDGTLDVARFSAIQSLRTLGTTRFFIDSFSKDQIRSIANGEVRTLTNPASAGVHGLRDGALSQAMFYLTMAVGPDAHGNLFVADAGNCRIRHIRFR